MPKRMVTLQLLSSYWLAAILPPLPGILCFGAVYNERVSTSSGLPPYSHHQGRKFGGYKIVPKRCEYTSSPEKEATSVCMFNHECARRGGTAVGSCVDGFLYGSCCALPSAGVFPSSVDVLDATPSGPHFGFASDPSATVRIPHPLVEHSPEETFLLHENGTVVQNANNPNDFLSFTERQTSSVPQTSQLPETHDYGAPADVQRIPNNASDSSEPYTTSSSRESFSPDFSPSVDSVSTTNVPPFTTTTDYFGHGSKFESTVANKNDHDHGHDDDDEQKLMEHTHKYGTDGSTSHVLWSPNDAESDTSTKVAQSFYTWNPNTPLPGATVHHVPGLKPDGSAGESTPIVVTMASYNISYHFPQTGSGSNEPESSKPNYSSILIAATPSQTSYDSNRPLSTGFVTEPGLGDNPAKMSTSRIELHAASPTTSSPLPAKPIETAVTFAVTEPTTSSLPSSIQTTMVTVAKPLWSGNLNSDTRTKPGYGPSYTTNSSLSASTPSYVTARSPSVTVRNATTQNDVFEADPTFSVYPGTNLHSNSTESLFDFPPVRDPNTNFTVAQQQQKPTVTSETTIFDDVEVTPQFVVDATLQDKVHAFVVKIVQSLQGNVEDLEQTLVAGESTITKNPTTQKPDARPQKPAITALLATSSAVVTKKPTLATSVAFFQLSSTSRTPTSLPVRKPIKVTTPSTSTKPASLSENEGDSQATTLKQSLEGNIDVRKECGIRPLSRKRGKIVGGKGTTFGEWPWQVLVREATWLGLFTKNKCGGVLITNKYVITAAHCQPGFLAHLVAVFGEYDISGDVESKRSVSKNVRRVILHRQYDAATFENDIALLELESPIQFDSHVAPICMPEGDEDFTGRVATVTGWGRLKYGGGVPSVLQEVQVPVIENRVCQEMFQTAGHSKVILSSFVCAGYANGQRDSCEGDSGGPLMVQRADGHWTLVATVSHGIKCAAPYLPGVYMRTTYYKPWLQSITGVQ